MQQQQQQQHYTHIHRSQYENEALPPGWERGVTRDGLVYYIEYDQSNLYSFSPNGELPLRRSHNRKTTSWLHPRECGYGEPLPPSFSSISKAHHKHPKKEKATSTARKSKPSSTTGAQLDDGAMSSSTSMIPTVTIPRSRKSAAARVTSPTTMEGDQPIDSSGGKRRRAASAKKVPKEPMSPVSGAEESTAAADSTIPQESFTRNRSKAKADVRPLALQATTSSIMWNAPLYVHRLLSLGLLLILCKT